MDASDFGENFDHPFDSEESVAKPAAKPQPSNSLKPLPDAELGNIVGTANMPQRRALQRLRSEEHTSELQSPCNLVCRLLLEKKKKNTILSKYLVLRSER